MVRLCLQTSAAPSPDQHTIQPTAQQELGLNPPKHSSSMARGILLNAAAHRALPRLSVASRLQSLPCRCSATHGRALTTYSLHISHSSATCRPLPFLMGLPPLAIYIRYLGPSESLEVWGEKLARYRCPSATKTPRLQATNRIPSWISSNGVCQKQSQQV